VHQVLDSLPQQEILAFVKKLHEPRETLVAVTLTNGETIAGYPGTRAHPMDKDWQFLAGEQLLISHVDFPSVLWIYIPIGDVAGIRQMDIGQPIYYSDNEFADPGREHERLHAEYLSHFPDDERPLREAIRKWRQTESKRIQARFTRELDEPWTYDNFEFRRIELATINRELRDLLRASAIRTAKRHGYQVDERSLGQFSVRSIPRFVGDFEPKPGERLYVDWEYVSRNKEGINGAGFGFVVSLSLSWNTSEARAANRLAKKALTGLSDVCREKLTLVRGHVAFLEVPGSTIRQSTISSGLKLSMDGGTWRAAIICMHPIVKAPDSDTPWVLSYWKEGRDEVPFEMLDTSVVPLDIFASVHSGRFTTSFGTASCFLKVHYAQAARL
jgi:hypothetical protein